MSKYKFKDVMESDDVRVSTKYRRFLFFFWIPVVTIVAFTDRSKYEEHIIPYRDTDKILPFITKINDYHSL